MLVQHHVDQNSQDWLDLRAGMITGSAIGKVMANYGKAFGEPAKVYAATIAVERLTDKPVESTFYNQHMKRGHEQEPLARMAYEAETFCDVDDAGFWSDGWYGSSPDGLVGDNGIIEIKCVTPGAHYAVIRKASFDTSYKWQMLYNTWLLQRDWCDFISYCFDFPSETRVHTHRLYLDQFDADIRKIESRLIQFDELVNEAIHTIQRAA